MLRKKGGRAVVQREPYKPKGGVRSLFLKFILINPRVPKGPP